MRGVVGCMNEVRVRANYSIGIGEGRGIYCHVLCLIRIAVRCAIAVKEISHKAVFEAILG